MTTNEFVYGLRVHIEDTDYTGTVYHANYLHFMERARSEWIEQLGMGSAWRETQGIHFLVHSMHLYFQKPARLHEYVDVVTTLKEMRPASFILDQYLRRANEPDKILCKAEVKIVCVDYNMKPCAIPELEKLRARAAS